jgi:hypothetical protein
MKQIISILIMLVSVIFASTRVYDIEPYKNVNAWSPYYGFIGQIFIATCDSFLWAEIFIGAPNDTGYNVQIIESTTNLPVAEGYAPGGFKIQYQYTHAPLSRTGLGSITKGKEYLLKITNARGDSINFYYDYNDPYKYGEIKISGGIDNESHPVEVIDLAARIEV